MCRFAVNQNYARCGGNCGSKIIGVSWLVITDAKSNKLKHVLKYAGKTKWNYKANNMT